MSKLLVLYNQPSDPAAFDRYYFDTHIPIAKKVPGLKSYTVNSGQPVMVMGTISPYLIAELEFENRGALESAMASPEGQAAAADTANFGQAGVTVLVYDTKTV